MADTQGGAERKRVLIAEDEENLGMINMLGMVNMQGRVYDPGLGRFLSPDPYMQAPFFSQSLNRYSYVFNNCYQAAWMMAWRPGSLMAIPLRSGAYQPDGHPRPGTPGARRRLYRY